MADGTIKTEAPPPAPAAKQFKVLKKPVAKPEQREQSKISFPYQDQDNAIQIARAIFEHGGGAFTKDQLAGAMKLSPVSGNFVLKVGAARLFGLIDFSDGKYSLTDLGFAIVDPTKEKAARAESFLRVPLYKKMYEAFRGKQLPPRPLGLENAFAKLGVLPKRKSDARLAFDKSAAQAGFFAHGNDRLIEPILGGASAPSKPAEEATGSVIAAEEVGPDVDPLIKGLLDRLPEPGSKWEHDKRVRWLQTLAANLAYVYPPDEKEPDIEIKSSPPIA